MKGSISTFRDLCNKFEDLVRIKYKVKDEEGAFYILSNQKEYKKFEKDINLIRKIRNLLSHGECKVEGKVAIEINENIIEKLKEIISLLENPPLVTSRYITEMFVVDLEEKLENLIKTMNEKK